MEPALSQEVRLAVRSPEERNVEPKRLLRALALACARRGVHILEGTPVIDFERQGAAVTAVTTPSRSYACKGVVIAGGAWSGILGRALTSPCPYLPYVDRFVARLPSASHKAHGIWIQGYLVPKADGRVVVGATEDEAGFDARPMLRE